MCTEKAPATLGRSLGGVMKWEKLWTDTARPPHDRKRVVHKTKQETGEADGPRRESSEEAKPVAVTKMETSWPSPSATRVFQERHRSPPAASQAWTPAIACPCFCRTSGSLLRLRVLPLHTGIYRPRRLISGVEWPG
jgi:hypothetical protein